MNPTRIVLVGGTGFVGSAIANRLSAAGVGVLVPTRRRSRAAHLLLLPTVEVVEADVHDPATLAGLFAGADTVVNLVGVLHSPSDQPWGAAFEQAHVELPRRIIAACEQAGVRRLVHVSALGADAGGPSEYQRSKAAGEAVVRTARGEWVILRPSVIFGRADRFLNLFASLARAFPVLPLAGANARLQPVWVEDVADVVWRCLCDPTAAGQTFEVAGARVYTLRELVRYVSALIGRPRPVLALPEALGMLQAWLMEFAPQPLMSRDNLRSLRVDNVAGGAPLPFGLAPAALEAVAPLWLGKADTRAQLDPFRRHARRPAR